MSSHDCFAALRHADPRNDADLGSRARAGAALAARILQTDPAETLVPRRPRRRAPRRRLLLFAVTGAIVLLGAAAASGALHLESPWQFRPLPAPKPLPQVPLPPPDHAPSAIVMMQGYMDQEQYLTEYERWTRKIELPPGATYRGIYPIGGGRVSVGSGAHDAIWEAMAYWTKAWMDATAAGDVRNAARAQGWVVALRRLLRVGGDSIRAAMTQGTARKYDDAIALAGAGFFQPLWHDLKGYTRPIEEPATHSR